MARSCRPGHLRGNGNPGRRPGATPQEIIATPVRTTILAAALALAPPGFVHAEGSEPAQAKSVALGAVSGIAYYTVERDGFHVVATLAQQGEGATPVRVEAVLAPGQSVVLSTPRSAGVAPEAIEISRRGDRVLFHGASAEAAD